MRVRALIATLRNASRFGERDTPGLPEGASRSPLHNGRLPPTTFFPVPQRRRSRRWGTGVPRARILVAETVIIPRASELLI